MCLIMMEMTDFTRGRGRLKTTMDVINAAKKISEAGTWLEDETFEETKRFFFLLYALNNQPIV